MLLVQKKKLLLSGFILPSQENSIDLVSQKEKENTNLAQSVARQCMVAAILHKLEAVPLDLGLCRKALIAIKSFGFIGKGISRGGEL